MVREKMKTFGWPQVVRKNENSSPFFILTTKPKTPHLLDLEGCPRRKGF
jgi:hypothetical protein